MNKRLRLSTRAILSGIIGASLFVLAGRLLPTGWQALAMSLFSAGASALFVLAAMSELTGYSLRDVVDARRGKAVDTIDERQAMRDRGAMLGLVKSFWVKGVLEQSLHGAALIQLRMEERTDAIRHTPDGRNDQS